MVNVLVVAGKFGIWQVENLCSFILGQGCLAGKILKVSKYLNYCICTLVNVKVSSLLFALCCSA